jgi:hypothetical protein
MDIGKIQMVIKPPLSFDYLKKEQKVEQLEFKEWIKCQLDIIKINPRD